MKKVFIYTIILLSVAMVSGATFQKTDAQNQYGFDCAKEYKASKINCLDDVKTCGIECDDAYPFDPDGAAAECKRICDSDRTSCDALADDWYRECLGLETTAPPVIDQKTQGKSVSLDEQIIEVDSADIARFESSVREEAKNIVEIKKCPGSFLPSQNSCVAEKLDFVIAKARESLLTLSFFEKRENTRPIIVEPVVIDTQGDVESLDFSIVSVTDVTFDSFPITLDLGNFQQFTSIYLPSPLEDSSSKDSAEWRVYSQGSADMKSGKSGAWKKIQFKTSVAQDTAVVTDKDRAILVSPGNTSVIEIEPASMVEIEPMKTPEVKESVAVTVYSGIVKIEDGESEDIFIQTPLTTTKSKHTKFAVLYNPEELYTATIVYEGEVEVTDVLHGLTATIAPADDGKPRMVVVPLASAKSAQGTIEKLLSGNWVWILGLVIFAGGGYLLYRKGVLRALPR